MNPRPATPRFGRRAPATSAVLALAIGIASCGDERHDCPSGQPVAVDLATWVGAVEAAPVDGAADGAAAAHERLLADVALTPPLPGDEPLAFVSVATTELDRGPGATPDILLAVRFAADDGAESLRAQVLRPVPDRPGSFCALGDELSHDKAPFEEPCLEPVEGFARTLSTEPLIAPGRDAVVARDVGGWCGTGTGRGDRLATSFWGVEAGRLSRYLEVVTFEAWYEAPAPPAEIRRARIELGDGWPRTIVVSETIECPPTPEAESPGLPEDGTGCTPATRTTTYRYEGGSYAAVDPAATDPGADPTETSEETTS